MDIKELYNKLLELEVLAKEKGLRGKVSAHINWIGDEFEIRAEVTEDMEYHQNRWREERNLKGSPEEYDKMLGQIRTWINELPKEETRTREHVVKVIGELIDKLPPGGNGVAAKAFESLAMILREEAQRLAENGLPKPREGEEG